MNCVKCDNPLPNETATFCPICGSRQSKKQKVCPECDTLAEIDEVFCGQCGHLLTVVEIKGATLMSVPKAMKFIGEPLVGIPKSYGQLTLYDNKIEYEPDDGSNITGSFGKWGKKLSQTLAQTADTFMLNQIVDARRIFFAGVKPMLVVEVGGERPCVVTFGGFLNELMVDQAISIINTYKRY